METININRPNEVMTKAYADVITKCPEVGIVSMFPQVWDTPALGFLGVAAAKDTLAYTVVFTDLAPESTTCFVYFDGRYAYTVHNPNDKFGMDVVAHNVGSILYRSDYETITEVEEPVPTELEHSPESQDDTPTNQ